MMVILASGMDTAAAAIAAQWGATQACVLTARDLSLPGWRQHLPSEATDRAVIDGRLAPQADISGVLTRIAGIFPQELAMIAPGDRTYVAAEMTAFLRFWLHRLPCRVLNRPSATALSGPWWRPEKWLDAAARLGIAVRPLSRNTAVHEIESDVVAQPIAVTIVGERTFGQVDIELIDQARRLAQAARVELVRFHFTSPAGDAKFIGANTFPDLDDHCVDAAFEYLNGGLPSRA